MYQRSYWVQSKIKGFSSSETVIKKQGKQIFVYKGSMLVFRIM